MKNPYSRITLVFDQIPRMAAAMATRTKALPLAKTRPTMLKLLVVLCCAFATTAAFGQVSRAWTNQNPAHATGAGDLGTAANWDPNGVPVPTSGPDGNGVYGDELLFDGLTTGPLALTTDTGLGGFSGSPWGLRVHLTSNQTNSVQFYTLVNGNSTGTRMQSFTIDAGAGAFHLGSTATTNALDMIFGGVAGQIHPFVNNSTNPATIYPNARWRHGGGGAHTFAFDGTGGWNVSNRLRTANNSPIIVTKSGPGTLIWTSNGVPSDIPDSVLQGPMVINDGTVILRSSGLLPTVIQSITHNGVLLKYDAASQAQSFPGTIFGSGTIQVNDGTLTLSGQNTFTGIILLSGGELVASSTEALGVSGPLGLGGVISFSGGTLGFSPNNSFDYSPRFSTAAGQLYRLNTAGQSVIFTNDLASSGATLTKLGNGSLTLAGTSSYSGLTTISGGTLAFQGAKTGSGNISVADGATLGVFNNGTQVTPSTLTLGTGAGANLEFDNITSIATPPLAAGTIASAGTSVISINSGTFSIGQSYPLLTWSGGSAPAVSLGIVDGAGGNLTTNGSTIQFNCTSVALIWSGLNNSSWDLITGNNWKVEGVPTTYSDPQQVVFNDTVTGTTNVALSGVVKPESVTINNSTNPYSITSSGGNFIGGSVRFSKRGPGTLSLAGGANTNNGVTTIRGGTVIVGTLANGGAPSDLGAASSAAANLVLNGGSLQYTGGVASIDRLFSVGTSGGTIDVAGSGPLTLNNAGTIGLSGNLTLTGSTADTNTIAAAMISSGGVNKDGTGTWVLTGANTYGGGTTISAGVLQIGAGGGSGTIGNGNVFNNASLDFNRSGTVTVPGTVSGSGPVTVRGSGTVVLANNNTYSGGTTITAGTLQVGNGGGSGSLRTDGPIVNDARLVFNTSGTFNYVGNGLISGTGNVIVQGGGRIKAKAANTYTGWTQIDAGSIFQPVEGNTGTLLSSAVTNNGTLMLVSQDNGRFIYNGGIHGSGRVRKGLNNFNPGDVTLLGTNTYTGGTFIGGGPIIFGDGINAGFGSFVGNVTFTNNLDTPDDQPRTLTFFRPEDFTFSGNIVTNFSGIQANLGIVQHNGAGKLTLTGNNTYGGGTVVALGILQVGTGGTAGTLGFGPVTLNGGLILNRAGDLDVGAVSGPGTVTKIGPGNVILGSTNTYTGLTVVSNGMLAIGSGGASSIIGDAELYGGALAPGGFGAAIGELTVNNLTLNPGRLVISLNRSSSPSNSLIRVNGTITQSGGSVKLLNFGPSLVVGDKFTICSQAIPGGAGMTIVTPGFTVVNNLAVDGSVTVASVSSDIPTVATSRSGNSLTLSWPASYTGLFLQGQTNTLAQGIRNNWVTILGTDAVNSFPTTMIASNTVFYRLSPR